jgi:hypothetical protein
MGSLGENLEALMNFLNQIGQSPPKRQIRILEIAPGMTADERGRLRATRAALCTPEVYDKRFDDLLSVGLPWINMSAVGVLDEFLIVTIEVPQRGPVAARTSVNYSGPSTAVLNEHWDASVVLSTE